MLYAIKTHKAMAAEMRPLRHFCLRKLKSLVGLSHDAHTSYEDMDQILKEHQIEWKWPDRIIREQRLEFFSKQIRNKEIRAISKGRINFILPWDIVTNGSELTIRELHNQEWW